MKLPDLSVITATYDESQNIKRLISKILAEFRKHKLKGEIIIVDDNSPDKTAEKAREMKKKNVRVIVRDHRAGIGSAMWEGIKKSRGEIIICMDADFSHPPDKIIELYCSAKKGYLAVGTRKHFDKSFDADFIHQCGTATINLLARCILSPEISDYSNGFIAIEKKSLLKLIETEKKDEKKSEKKNTKKIFDHDLYGVPLISAALSAKMKIQPINAPYKRRAQGESKIRFGKGLHLVVQEIAFLCRQQWQK